MFLDSESQIRNSKFRGSFPISALKTDIPHVDSENWTNISPYLGNGARYELSYPLSPTFIFKSS